MSPGHLTSPTASSGDPSPYHTTRHGPNQKRRSFRAGETGARCYDATLMGSILQQAWVPILVLVCVAALLRMGMGRWLHDPAGPDAPWSWRLDLGLCVGCTAVVAALAGGWLAPLHLRGDAFLTADFHEYCAGVTRFGEGAANTFLHKRSALALLPATVLSWPLGRLGGLWAAAILSVGVTGGALYLWGRAIHGRLAGVAAACLALGFGPVVLGTRHMTSYPTLGAAFALAAAAGALAVRFRSRAALALGGCGAALALSVDARGLIFALPVLAICLVTACRAAPREWPLRVLAVLIPVAVSFLLGPLFFSEAAQSLEQQVDVRPLFHRAGMSGPPYDPPWDVPAGHVWGRSPPWRIPSTLAFLWGQSRIPGPTGSWTGVPSSELRHAAVGIWLPLLAVGLAAAIGGLVRRPWRLLALLATLAPFAAALRGAATMVELEPRFLAHGQIGAALVLGVGFAAALESRPWRRRAGGPPVGEGRALGRASIVAAVLLLLVTGILPSWFAPSTAWRHRWRSTVMEVHQAILGLEPEGEPPHVVQMHRTCHAALRGDAAAGRIPAVMRPPPPPPPSHE